MVSQCTWVDCNEVATTPQIASDGKQWANLCDTHAKQFDSELLDAKKVISNWVKAQGGAKEAVKRMQPGIDASVKLGQFLTRMKSKRRR